MQDREVGDMANLPAGLLDPETKVSLLAEEEEPLVHEPGALESLPPHEHERATRPVAGDVLLVNAEVELALAEP